MKNDPTTFLGLVGRGLKLREIEKFYKKSFLSFINKKADFSLIRREVISKKLASDALPCFSPAGELAAYVEELDSLCRQCPFIKRCHEFIDTNYRSSIAELHIHLHTIGCLEDNEKLSPIGNIARYFPQGGGLMLAAMIDNGELQGDQMIKVLELMACLSLARFKEPGYSSKYQFPFDIRPLEQRLEAYYPNELFEELYDPPSARRNFAVIREFNPAAGYVVKEWVLGASWISLRQKVCHEKFAEGDLVALLYRCATYLQSLSQAGIPSLSQAARDLRNDILREPLTPSIIVKEVGQSDEQSTDD